MARIAYHHGNLKAELVHTGVRLARVNGSSALVVREIAREVGVTSAAVYRHFPDIDHLRAEVAREARQELAWAMIRARERVPAGRSRAKRCIARFSATGAAYVQFAIDEPGWFDIAFTRCPVTPPEPDSPYTWDVLNESLDELVHIGALDPALRSAAPLIAWTAVHGLASIVVDGALSRNMSVDVARDTVLASVRRSLGLRG